MWFDIIFDAAALKFEPLSPSLGLRVNLFPSRFLFRKRFKGPLTQLQQNGQLKRSFDNGCLALSANRMVLSRTRFILSPKTMDT